jgi:hypothetical protein
MTEFESLQERVDVIRATGDAQLASRAWHALSAVLRSNPWPQKIEFRFVSFDAAARFGVAAQEQLLAGSVALANNFLRRRTKMRILIVPGTNGDSWAGAISGNPARRQEQSDFVVKVFWSFAAQASRKHDSQSGHLTDRDSWRRRCGLWGNSNQRRAQGP